MSTASSGVRSWDRFVEGASTDVAALDEGIAALADGAAGELVGELAHRAFRVGMSSLLAGAEEVGRLALAVEEALDRALLGELDVRAARELLAPAREGLREAMAQLRNADRSGARVEGVSLADIARRVLEEISAGAVRGEVSAASPSVPDLAVSRTSEEGAFVWTPAVDDDMVELFFDEAAERIEAVAQKLLALERAPGDGEILRDLFRDLHTVKGSSAMVGLAPMNRLAHASEDLVGQLRDGERAADAAVVDALLATLDGLRGMLEQARSRRAVALDPAPLLRRLRDPAAAAAGPPTPTALAPTAAGLILTTPVHSPVSPDPASATPNAGPAAPAGQGPSAQTVNKATIRVDFDKLDRLLNLVGELVLGRDGLRSASAALSAVTGELSSERALSRRGQGKPRDGEGRRASLALQEELGRVERVLGSIAGDLEASTAGLDTISGELRDQVMRLRMIPVGGVFRKHQRTVRDLGQALGKRVHLELWGDDTELDKLLVEALDEPLMHLVRNAVDHGMETPAEREAAGKPADGTVLLSASHRGNQVVITVADDGRGMSPVHLRRKALEKGIVSLAEVDAMDDRAALDLVFRPGFSTAAAVSDVSGRGVGLDVVRQTIVTRLKGTIEIDSTPGEGTRFVLRLPLTLAILQVLLARVAGEMLAIPLDSVDRTLMITPADVQLVADRETILVSGRNIPLVRLAGVLELEGPEPDDAIAVVLTEQGGELYGLACDHLVEKKEVVIKSLGELLAAVPCAAGATLLGDRCALILDVPAVVQRALRRPPQRRREKRPVAARSRGAVLLVDDSDTVREALKRLLLDAGYDVTTAEDGRAALELCKERTFDLVSTDVMMPHMDGYDLTRALRALPTYKDIPIVMVTTRGERIDQVRGFDAGVDDYITKPHDRQLLLRSIQKLLGGDGEAE